MTFNFEEGYSISFNGDYGGYTTYRLQFISDYTNKELVVLPGDTRKWICGLDLVLANERYTEFTLTQWFPVPRGGQYSGFYTYNLYGTMDAVTSLEDFVPEDWTTLDTGLIKILTPDVNGNINRYQYESPNDDAQSYVIYNP